MIYVCKLRDSSEEILKGDRVITNLNELYSTLLSSTLSKIIFTKEFVDEYFTKSSLSEFIENAKKINPNCGFECQGFSIDKFYDNAIKKLSKVSNPDDMHKMFILNEKEMFLTIRKLIDFYNEGFDKIVESNSKLSGLQSIVLEKNNESKKIAERLSKLEDLNNLYSSKLDRIIKSIRVSQNKEKFNEDLTFNVRGNSYTKILYIKEVTRVRYLDTLIGYIQEILRALYGMPTRVLYIEPYYAYSRAEYYSSAVPIWRASTLDILQSDIVMCGFQQNTVRDIMNNSLNIKFLIVIDRAGYETPHIVANNVELFYVSANPKDVDVYQKGVDSRRIISYDKNNLRIPYLEGFDLKERDVKMRLYSDMKITKTILNALESKGEHSNEDK